MKKENSLFRIYFRHVKWPVKDAVIDICNQIVIVNYQLNLVTVKRERVFSFKKTIIKST